MTQVNSPVRIKAVHLVMLLAGKAVPVVYHNNLVGVVQPVDAQLTFPRGSTDEEIMALFDAVQSESANAQE